MGKLTRKSSILLTAMVLAAVMLTSSSLMVAHAVVSTAGDSTKSTRVAFPDLTGPYKVGRAAFEWVDQSRAEGYASIPGLKRDLMVDIWFPADPAKRSKIAPYMGDSVTWDIVTKHPELEDMIQTHAYATTTVAADKPNYPVLILEPEVTLPAFSY